MKVLWIGNSHTFFHDMPQLTAMLYEAGTGEKMESVMLAHPAMDWKWHEEQFFEIRYNLKYGQYDACILQQAAHPFPGEEITLQTGKKLIEMCKNAETRPIVTMTWAKEKEPFHQQEMIDVYEKLGRMEQVQISPVGKVWMQIRKEMPEINLYHRDGAHASIYGAYLNACCHYNLLSGKSCLGLPAIGKDFMKQNTLPGIRRQVKSLEEPVDIELNQKICFNIQETVEKVMQK